MKKIPELPVEKLRRRCDPARFKFKTTEDVPPLTGIIGQERATKAMNFGLRVKNKGYNIFMAGPTGTGKTSYARSMIKQLAAQGKAPDDWCYIYNFREPEKPIAINLPAGNGEKLVKDMERLIEEFKNDIPKALDSEDYEKQRNAIMEKYQKESNSLMEALEQKVSKQGFVLKRTGKGIFIIPLFEGKPMEQGQMEALSDEQRKEIEEKSKAVQLQMDETMRKIRTLENQAKEEISTLEKKIVLTVIRPDIEYMKRRYEKFPRVVEYLDEIQKDVIQHLDRFKIKDDKDSALPWFLTEPRDESFFIRYKVNLFVNNSGCEGAPMVCETNPTYYNLFGKIEGKAQFGAITTDFTMIRSGAIHRANGGYLVIQALDILKEPFSWNALKRTLDNREAAVENIGESFRAIPITTIKPEPIPLDVKVILIGSPFIYHLLYNYDEDFRKLFKIKADFDVTMDRNDENIDKYAAFISSLCRREGLKHFDASAVARVIEHSSRLAEDQIKLSTRFNEIVEVLYEASAWAELDDAEYVTEEHVEKAIDEKVYRSSMIEDKIQEMIIRGEILVDTSGEAVGQINGLSVYQTGDYSFGRPSRITARTYLGEEGIINIEREAKMSGRIHDKGVLILSGYLGGKYAGERPLTLTATLAFEQSYGGVDGDSASCAELIALLSSISGIPIKQNIAITGSINQKGGIQPIGGVNQKIEGFFKVCRQRGLDGSHGVVIPIQNVDNLMLNREVIEAVKTGMFHIYPVKTVDEAIEIMTGIPADEFHKKVSGRLDRMAEEAKKHSPLSQENKTD
ncbi:MAG: hypothetical protein PWQ82_1277 [Thermosediminibacterales bacterium]|nr:hypothetical protein [Thermosediminibacterales bacterium]